MGPLDDVTISGYLVAMNTVGVAALKARLSEYLRRVRRGHEVTVLDRQTPIARIVPYGSGGAALEVRKPVPGAPPLHRVPLPPPLTVKLDVVTLLLEERQGER
jgi:prevent-host-death family protein